VMEMNQMASHIQVCSCICFQIGRKRRLWCDAIG
jgi:hypothetical protein